MIIVLVEGIIFLIAMYVCKESRYVHRNNSTIILYRMISGGIATLTCVLLSYTFDSNLFYGWNTLNLNSLSFTLLYLGQLLLNLYLKRQIIPELSLITLRDLVFGPMYEEIVFRGAMIPLLSGKYQKIIISSFIFGISHIHHGIFEYLTGNIDLKDSIVTCMFHFTYTFIFGLVSSYYFIITKSIIGVILLHSVCNYFGIPEFTVTKGDERIVFWTGTMVGLYLFFISS